MKLGMSMAANSTTQLSFHGNKVKEGRKMRQKKLITKKKQIFKNITLIVVVVMIKMLDEKKQYKSNLMKFYVKKMLRPKVLQIQLCTRALNEISLSDFIKKYAQIMCI